MKPRPHQLQCLQRVVRENTIVNMPTGTGKTLVAVLVIDHFRDAGKVIFLVPTRPLVGQQADYVRTNCARTTAVAELQGAKTDHLSAGEWKDIVNSNDVLVGTAEVFRRALVDTKFLRLGDFSLLIFDECHNAVGNSAMASIMRDSVHRCTGAAPRILGLTASFVHGSLANIEKKRRDLEGLMQATIFCPDVEERPMEFTRIFYEPTVMPAMEDVVKSKVEALVGLATQCGVPLKETQSAIRRGVHVFSELGVSAFVYFLRECVAPQVQVHLEQVAEVRGGQSQNTRQALEGVSRLRQAMRDAADQLSRDGSLTGFPNVTEKAQKLLDLIRRLQREAGGSGAAQTRIIVFCEQTVLAYPVAHLLEHHIKCKVGTCTGVGSMTDGQRKQALQSFRSGEVPLLTCTAALEEGLDVSECEVVVRFSSFTTTKSHIQGSGRARKWGAKVFYFDNDPKREVAGADLVQRTAKESSLSLTRSEMKDSRAHSDVEGVHPYRTESGAEISVFNCVQLVYEYAARTMGQSFRPEESMLTYEEEVVSDFPPLRRKKLVMVRIPSPDGFFDVRVDAVDKWWGELDVKDVADKARMKNWDPTDKELRRFMYVVAVEVSRRGFLDNNNQPTARALRETRFKCEAWQMSPGVKIGVKYDSRGLNAAPSKGPAAPPTANQAPSSSAAPLVVRPSFAPAQRPVVGTVAGLDNFKGRLNELMMPLNSSSISYRSIPDGDGFHASVTLPDGRAFKAPARCATKKAAEQSAAEAALRELEDSSSPPSVPAASSTASVAPAAAEAARQNYKGQLNEMMVGVTYTTAAVPGGFCATALLPDGRSWQSAAPASTKKEAEQQAAQAACVALAPAAASARPRPAPALRPSAAVAAPAAGAAALDAAPAQEEDESLLSRILSEVLDAEVIPLTDLVRRCGLPKATVNKHLYELQSRGLLRRVVESPAVWAVAS